jgi:hypothetical protein
MPDGTYRVDFTGGYDRIYIDYINPQTGDTILIVESAKELKGFEGTEVSSGDFDGRIATHTEPFRYTQLMWQRDDEYFFLSASTLGEQETIKIAQSLHLQRVPAEPPAEP